jgi:hypothetical protein
LLGLPARGGAVLVEIAGMNPDDIRPVAVLGAKRSIREYAP